MPSRLARFAAYTWFLAAGAMVCSTVWYVIATYTPIQFFDQWFEVAWYRDYVEGRVPLTTLWRLHNEHNIFFPRLTFLLDLTVFHGTNVSLLVWCLLVQAGTCGLLIREARRAAFGAGVTAFLAGMYVLFLFSFTQMENFISPFQVTFVFVVAAPVGAITCLADYVERRERQPRADVWLALSLACGIIGTFSMANGVLVWPLLLFVAVIRRLPARPLFVVAVVACCAIGRWYADRTGIGLAPSGPRPFAQMLVFLTMYLGAPFGTLSEEVAGVAGTLGLCLAVGLSLLVVRDLRTRSRFTHVFLMVLWFTLGSALATTLGRSDWGHRIALVSRYATTSLVFWASIISLLVAVIHTAPVRRELSLGVLMGVVAVACAALLLPAQVRAGQAGRDMATKKRLGELALVVGVDDAALGALNPDRGMLLDLGSFLRERRLSTFAAAWPHWVGTPLADVVALDPALDMAGEFVSARTHAAPFLTPGPTAGVRVRGWAKDSRTHTAPRLILLADDRGLIRGLARPGARPDAVTTLYGASATDATAWFGYARVEGNRPLRAYALADDGRTAHVLLGVHFVGDLTVHAAAVPVSAWAGAARWGQQPPAQTGARFTGGYAFGSAHLVGDQKLRSAPIAIGDAQYLVVPYTTGPDPRGLALSVVTGAGDKPLATRALREPANSWVNWTIPVGRGEEWPVRIQVRDAGSAPGQWIAVGAPRLVGPPAP